MNIVFFSLKTIYFEKYTSVRLKRHFLNYQYSYVKFFYFLLEFQAKV